MVRRENLPRDWMELTNTGLFCGFSTNECKMSTKFQLHVQLCSCTAIGVLPSVFETMLIIMVRIVISTLKTDPFIIVKLYSLPTIFLL